MKGLRLWIKSQGLWNFLEKKIKGQGNSVYH